MGERWERGQRSGRAGGRAVGWDEKASGEGEGEKWPHFCWPCLRRPPRSFPFPDENERLPFLSTRTSFRDEFCYVMDAKSIGNLGRYLNVSSPLAPPLRLAPARFHVESISFGIFQDDAHRISAQILYANSHLPEGQPVPIFR